MHHPECLAVSLKGHSKRKKAESVIGDFVEEPIKSMVKGERVRAAAGLFK